MAADGNIKKIVILGISKPTGSTTMPIAPTSLNECCCDFTRMVLADTSDSANSFKNDVTSELFKFMAAVSDCTLYLQQYDELTGDFSTVATLDNNDYGTLYSFGFYFNSYNEKYIGYQLSWNAILDAFGSGGYRIKAQPPTVFGFDLSQYSDTFCLKSYKDYLADGTVKIETYNNRLTGDKSNDKRFFDYGDLDWYNSYRFKGFFGYPETNIDRQNITYDTGKKDWVKDEQEPEYKLKLFMLPMKFHEIVRVDVLQSDRILITDYNTSNNLAYIQKEVRPNSGYKPTYHELQSQLSSVEIKFIQSYNRLIKRRS